MITHNKIYYTDFIDLQILFSKIDLTNIRVLPLSKKEYENYLSNRTSDDLILETEYEKIKHQSAIVGLLETIDHSPENPIIKNKSYMYTLISMY